MTGNNNKAYYVAWIHYSCLFLILHDYLTSLWFDRL